MAFDPEFLELMPNTVRVRRFLGRDPKGNPAYSAPEDWRCRIEASKRRVGSADTTGTVVFRTVTETTLIGPYVNPAFGPGDRIILPDDAVVSIGDTQDVIVEEDEDGPHHMTIAVNARKAT